MKLRDTFMSSPICVKILKYPGVLARTLHVEDFFYMLNLDFFLMPLQLILMIIKKNVMADLRNWTNV